MSITNVQDPSSMVSEQEIEINESLSLGGSTTIEKKTKIESLGIYLPNKEVSTLDVLIGCKESINYPLERLTGIKSRRMAGDSEFSIHLAKNAVQECLARSAYEADDVELLICCNLSRYDGPNFQFTFEPSTSIRLRSQLNIPNALCFDISNACAGMFTGINIADAFLKAGVVNNVLVVSGEYLTHSTKTAQQEINDIYDDRMACLTLGDCGAAVLLEQSDDPQVGFHEIDMYTLGKYSDCCIAKPTDSTAGGAIMFTDSARIHDVAINQTVKDVARALGRNNWKSSDLQHLIVHQTARSAIIDFIRQFNDYYNEAFFDTKNVVINLENRGNTASTTHLLAIWDNIHNGSINNGENILFSVQASGITLGSAPYTFDDLPERMRNFAKPIKKSTNVVNISQRKKKLSKAIKRVRIESLGTIKDSNILRTDKTAITLATTAAENCLKISQFSKSDIDLLIHAGVHRDEFISEPALATLIARDLNLNPDPSADDESKTFAFDVINGAMSFLNACHIAVMMLGTSKFNTAMILASEIENNSELDGRPILGIKETGSAAILALASNEEDTGFLSFSFQYYTDHVDKFYSKVGQEDGMSYLDIRKSPRLNDYYLECIQEAVGTYLNQEGISKDEIDYVFPPQISKEFVTRFQSALGFDSKKVAAVANSHDYFTSSTVYSMQTALDSGQVKKGDVGLIVNVGTGIQVACALYQF